MQLRYFLLHQDTVVVDEKKSNRQLMFSEALF